MNQVKYYYRLNSKGIDNWDKKDVENNNQILVSFDVLLEPLELLRTSYENQNKDRAQIIVCVMPDESLLLNDVIELSVYHKIKKKLFSKKIKENIYALCITKGSPNGVDVCFYNTKDFDEVKQIFHDYVVNQKTPDLSIWEIVNC